MNLKLKLLIGTAYLICFSALIFVIFSNFDFKDLSDINFFKDNQQLLEDFKTENILITLIIFSIFSIIWILLLGFVSPLALFAGFVFGKWTGTLVSIVSFSVGATMLYCLANFFFKDFIKNKFSTKIEKFINLFNKNDFLYFTLFRFTGGGMPFAVQNILPVIFEMKIKKYFFSTLLGIVPGIFVITSVGAGVGNFIGRNDSIVWIELIKDPEIYFPILIFIVVLIFAAVINKLFFNNKI
ncbi:VTT domain-containing protein [Pelagibacteraceae bacterium]|nr:VTT domain-containing protein [Pelagibacteraceae bacterium]